MPQAIPDEPKSKSTRIPAPLAAELERIAATFRMSESKVIELAIERLVDFVNQNHRLPLEVEAELGPKKGKGGK